MTWTSARELMEEIERVLPEGGEWCTLERAQTLAAIVLALRAKQVVEIGVWSGGSAIPMLLALRHLRVTVGHEGKLLAIDPWAPAASVVGQEGAHLEWWSGVDHEAAYQTFCVRLGKHDVWTNCDVVRLPSDGVAPPASIDLLSIDGNHGEQAVRDVDRFARKVVPGGFLVLDDVDWPGDHVSHARELARDMGFVNRYPLAKGCVMQRWQSP